MSLMDDDTASEESESARSRDDIMSAGFSHKCCTTIRSPIRRQPENSFPALASNQPGTMRQGEDTEVASGNIIY